MKNIIFLTVCFSFLLAFSTNAAEMRTWSTADGKFKTEAEFVELSEDGRTVTIRKKDGDEKKVPLDRLSKEDREYVEKYLEKETDEAKKLAAAGFRTWSTADGKFETEAKFVRVSQDGKTVTVRKKDGEDKKVPLDRLSKEDQEHVGNCLKKKAENAKKLAAIAKKRDAKKAQKIREEGERRRQAQSAKVDQIINTVEQIKRLEDQMRLNDAFLRSRGRR